MSCLTTRRIPPSSQGHRSFVQYHGEDDGEDREMPLGSRFRQLQTNETVEHRRAPSSHPQSLFRLKGKSQKNSCNRYRMFEQTVSARDWEEVDGNGGCPRAD